MKFVICLALASAFLHSTNAEAPLLRQQASFTTIEDLQLLTSDFNGSPGETFEFQHPEFHGKKLGIKQHDGDWCDSVKSYSGYIDAGHGKEMFFTFFESRHDPKNDPVVMWVNGGPGGSSMLGLFQELGPCRIDDSTSINGTSKNPYSWNSNANIIFLDEPLGVGLSYSRHGQKVGTTEEAALDVQAFLSLFFQTFKSFAKNDFYMAGESYGGRYLPVFAGTALDMNARNVKRGLPEINLRGVLIGNGVTSAFQTMESYYTYQCTSIPGIGKPLQSVGTCVQMRKALPYCMEMVQSECLRRHDSIGCTGAMSFCEAALGEPFGRLDLNPYDVSKSCTPKQLDEGLCYGEIVRNITTYLNLPEVRSMLGVSSHTGNFSVISEKVFQRFVASHDETDMTWLYVAALLERKIPVISYVGTFDYICNYIGNEAWAEELEWTGGPGYTAAQVRDWNVDGKVAGYTKTYGGLTFATVKGAGHMVPADKPKEALELLNRWIRGGGDAL